MSKEELIKAMAKTLSLALERITKEPKRQKPKVIVKPKKRRIKSKKPKAPLEQAFANRSVPSFYGFTPFVS